MMPFVLIVLAMFWVIWCLGSTPRPHIHYEDSGTLCAIKNFIAIVVALGSVLLAGWIIAQAYF